MHPNGSDAGGRGGTTSTAPSSTYRESGVDLDAAAASVGRIAALARTTLAGTGAAGRAPIGHFGGTFRLPGGGDQILVASADGVGTKLKLAFVLGGDAHARVGVDLVNHCVNDVLALGATPLFFLDYIATGRLDPDTVERLVGGMAAACRENGLALIGGETAEMPDFYAAGEYDVAGFIVGTVSPDRTVDGAAVRDGDVLIGLPSDGLHTNGYSLARRIVGLTGDRALDRALLAAPLPGGDGESLGDALMRPHRSYLATVGPLLAEGLVRGMAHITGGGLLDNLPRMLPDGLAAVLDPRSWTPPPVFAHLVVAGGVPPAERYRAFNMGIGFVLAVAPDDAARAIARIERDGGPTPVRLGRVGPLDPGQTPIVRGLVDYTDGDPTDA